MLNVSGLTSIIRSSPDLYLIFDTTFYIIEASDAYLQTTMVKRENVLGRTIFEIFPDNPNDPQATGRANLISSVSRVLKSKAPDEMLVQKHDIRRPPHQGGDFEERYWRVLNAPVMDENNNVKYIIHRVEDVTNLQNLENLKVESSPKIQLLIENIKDYAIIMLDDKQNIVTWNIGAELILGYKIDEILGKPISMVFSILSDDNQFKIAREEGHYQEESWRKRKNGSQFWAHVVMTPIYGVNNQLIGYGKVISDLTLKKEIETAKDEFISIVNHELRTPLTAIIGAIKLLKSGVASSSKLNMELLDSAYNNCERLLKLITDILEIEKITANGIHFDIQEVELGSLIDFTLSINMVFSQENRITLISSLPNEDIKVKIDPNRLIQVLTNLISNAIKFSWPGGKVTVSLKKKKNIARIAITNRGKGISEEFKNKIFEKFSQADATTTRSNSGTGLGLAISKALLEKQGSDIHFKSIPDKRTTFYFDLPIILK